MPKVWNSEWLPNKAKEYSHQFYENKYKNVKKSIYERKYHLGKHNCKYISDKEINY